MIELTMTGKASAEMQMASKGSVTLSVDGARGTSHYPALTDKPKIEGVTLLGDKSFEQLGLSAVTLQEIDNLIFG